MKRFMNKKVAAIAAAVGLTLGLGGAAFAYFTSTGSGSGSVTTGSPTPWGVVAGATTGSAALFPGVGSQTVPFTITNLGTGDQALNTETFTVAADGSGNVETTAGDSSTAVPGCLAAWYSLTPGSVAPANGTTIVPGGTATDSVAVALTNVPDNQDACAAVSPAITLNVA